jgi:hypothetical protein
VYFGEHLALPSARKGRGGGRQDDGRVVWWSAKMSEGIFRIKRDRRERGSATRTITYTGLDGVRSAVGRAKGRVYCRREGGGGLKVLEGWLVLSTRYLKPETMIRIDKREGSKAKL